jgi:hypothetical protein
MAPTVSDPTATDARATRWTTALSQPTAGYVLLTNGSVT